MNEKQLKLAKEVFKCRKCPNLQKPPIFLEGNPDSQVWVIGLNPKLDDFHYVKNAPNFKEYLKEQANYFFSGHVHSYFSDFHHVFSSDWLKKFQESVTHTDLVKCSSAGYDKTVKDAVDECGKFLRMQLELFKPKLIICNGVDVCSWFEKTYHIEINDKTRTDIKLDDGWAFTVIFSGFIRRIDNFAKRRLRREIAEALNELNIGI